MTFRRQKDALTLMLVALMLALATMLSPASPATATHESFTFDLSAGIACAFPLRVEIRSADHGRVSRAFTDKNGNPVRVLTTGKGDDLVFTNLDNGATFSLKGTGSVSDVRVNPDGSTTVASTGH